MRDENIKEIKEIEINETEINETETRDGEYVIDKDGTLVPKWLYLRSLKQAG